MPHKNPYVLSERPLLGVMKDDYEGTEKTGRITFGRTVDGAHLARMSQNGHEFVASHPDNALKAAAAVQRQVENADRAGTTALPAHMKRA